MTVWSSLEDFVDRHRRLFVLTGALAAARAPALRTIATPRAGGSGDKEGAAALKDAG